MGSDDFQKGAEKNPTPQQVKNAIDWFDALSPNEKFRVQYVYDSMGGGEEADSADYEGRWQKFLMDKPMKLVFDCYGESDFTWRYIMHNENVVMYSVTLRLLSDVDNKLHIKGSRIIAFFYETDGKVKPIPRKSITQSIMCRGQDLSTDHKQISLTKKGTDTFHDGKPMIGWENSAALDLGFDLNDTRWPR